MKNLEISQDGSVGIHLKKFMNILIQSNGWFLVTTVKVEAENWLSLQCMNIHIQSFTKFLFDLLATKHVLSVTEVLEWLNF